MPSFREGVKLMKKLILGFIAALVAGSVAHAELQQSNTVASSELITDFALIKDSTNADVVASLSLYKAGTEDRGPVLLATSADEKITISVGENSAVCLPEKDCRLPFVNGASYRVELQRFNGEVISATTLLPNETRILSPAENTVAAVDEALDFSWVVARASGTRGLAVSVFLGEQTKTCSTQGSVDWKTEGTATVPANYVGHCQPPLKARFVVFYVNVIPMAGVAGGTLKGYSTATLHFSYVDRNVVIESAPFTHVEARELVNATRDGKSVSTQTLLRR